MEEIMEKARIDASGRTVIPAKARRLAGLHEGDVLLIASRGEVILRSQRGNPASIHQWHRDMLASHLAARSLSKEKGKWVSSDYGRRKLGM